MANIWKDGCIVKDNIKNGCKYCAALHSKWCCPLDELRKTLKDKESQLSKNAAKIEQLSQAIPMILHCPFCQAQHLDLGEWATKKHKTHLCVNCEKTWRPANVPTVGVESLEVQNI